MGFRSVGYERSQKGKLTNGWSKLYGNSLGEEHPVSVFALKKNLQNLRVVSFSSPKRVRL